MDVNGPSQDGDLAEQIRLSVSKTIAIEEKHISNIIPLCYNLIFNPTARSAP